MHFIDEDTGSGSENLLAEVAYWDLNSGLTETNASVPVYHPPPPFPNWYTIPEHPFYQNT